MMTARTGRTPFARQAYVNRAGHCNVTPAATRGGRQHGQRTCDDRPLGCDDDRRRAPGQRRGKNGIGPCGPGAVMCVAPCVRRTHGAAAACPERRLGGR